MRALIWLTLLSATSFALRSPGQLCKQLSVSGSITSKADFSRVFANDLEMRLTPLRADNGWVISVGPRGSDEDWTYPVTFPIRTGEQQVMGTGYRSTVQEKLAHPITVEFVLTHPDFVKYSEMAQSTLDSPRPEAAGEYIKRVARLKKGELTVIATSYEKGDTAETVKEMKFQATILVPKSFEAADTSWVSVPCPASWK